jgi:hypothetical protein
LPPLHHARKSDVPRLPGRFFNVTFMLSSSSKKASD